MINTKIRLMKLSAVENPMVPTPDVLLDDFTPGSYNNGLHSVPVDYTIEGFLCGDIEIDKPLSVRRTMRNGVRMFGHLTTSYIKAIIPSDNGLVLETENSVYRLEWIDGFVEESKE